MNFPLKNIPARTAQPRNHGLTMITDKGLSVEETVNMLSVSGPHIDLAKLAFGTAFVIPELEEKIKVYQANNVPVYFGGLLFEAFVARNQFNDFLALLEKYNISHVEISDGSINITHAEKCGYIEKMAVNRTVLSEVGSKDQDRVQVTPPYRWIEWMQAELNAGATYVIAEARESGNVGLYRDSGEVREGLVHEILTKIPAEKIIWEAPRKDQQLFFIQILGANANLGNIAPKEVISLEAMRVGLRSDTFELFLNS